MKFVGLFSLKQSVDQMKLAEIIARRADYEFLTGLHLIGEYWSGNTDPAVVSIFEADESAALMINSVVWIDIFDVKIFPVNTWEEGLEKLTQHLAGQ